MPHFESLGYVFHPQVNPADVLMDILSGKGANSKTYSPDDLADIWAEETKALTNTAAKVDLHESLLQIIKTRGSSLVKQTYFCAERSLLQQFRTINSFWLEIFVGLLAGVLMVRFDIPF